jgi:hypothetical protein
VAGKMRLSLRIANAIRVIQTITIAAVIKMNKETIDHSVGIRKANTPAVI